MVAPRVLRFLSRGVLRVVIGAGGVIAGAGLCGAQPQKAPADYPTRPLRIIVTSSPGTADDFFARAVGDELSTAYRERVVIENRAGAGGLIGNALMSRASADGYTLGMISVSRIITALMHDRPPYQALADVVGVAHVASITNVLAVAPSTTARTAPEFIAQARLRAGELNYASLGSGSASHLAGELFSRAVGVEAMHVPFTNLTGIFVEMGLGHVHYTVLTLPAVLGSLREGRLRALAVMTRQRSPALPAVPPIAEFGLPEAQFDSWSGIVAPVGTPRRIVEQLHGDIVRGLRKPALRDLFVRQGAESTPESTPDGFGRLMRNEYLRYEAILRQQVVRRI
ncbi:MAG TPA: tripartite tricarboxylate transporter substrate-binding protein [Burkholderiales bacterium]|nr:tripartite tricarboxylate transporter substrate-binding protein [Burkholderiales bacterium]